MFLISVFRHAPIKSPLNELASAFTSLPPFPYYSQFRRERERKPIVEKSLFWSLSPPLPLLSPSPCKCAERERDEQWRSLFLYSSSFTRESSRQYPKEPIVKSRLNAFRFVFHCRDVQSEGLERLFFVPPTHYNQLGFNKWKEKSFSSILQCLSGVDYSGQSEKMRLPIPFLFDDPSHIQGKER